MSDAGSLVGVGIAVALGSHLTPLAGSYIEKSDIVLAATSDGIIVDMHMTLLIPPATSMQPNPEVRKRLAAIELSASGNA